MSTRDNHGIVVRLDIPPDHHPDTLRGKSPGANLGRQALTGIYEAYGKINDTAAKVADKGRLASAAQPFAERAVQQAGRAVTTLQGQIKALDSEIAAAIITQVEPQLASQIRAHFAKAGSALVGIKTAIDNGDKATTAAVLKAPAFLSGLTDKNQAVLRMAAAERYAPDQVQQRSETTAALERVERATEHFTTTVAGKLRQWRDEDAKIIQEALS